MSCHSGTGRRWYEATTPPRSFTWLHYGVKTLVRRQVGPTCVPNAVCAALEMAYQIHCRQKILLSEHELIEYGISGSSSFALAWISKNGVSLRDDYLQGKQDGKIIFIYDFIRGPSLHSSDLIKFIFRQPAEFYKIDGKVANVLHTMVAVGWVLDDKNEVYFMVHNSWGSDWGKNGYGWIHQSCIERVRVPILYRDCRVIA
ncbi:thiol protease SEN102-like [Coffea arabica]|uniref:Thiol protease SEN102-like n=1 Tax=Coffea arabica TaxID=13443 RepID=A0ABM4W7D4_COFAR